MIELKALDTLAFCGVVLLLGDGLRRLLPFLARVNIPTPVIGGLVVALIVLLARREGVTLVTFDTSMQSPLMVAFFTTVGFGASLSLLRSGGKLVVVFLAAATVLAILQNLLGALIAVVFGLHPLFGVLSGSVTLTGGPATGLAFAPLFEQAGVAGAQSIAVAAAMAGIVSGALAGGPVATWLVEKHRLRTAPPRSEIAAPNAREAGGDSDEEVVEQWTAPVHLDAHTLLRNIVFLLAAMWVGSWLSAGVAAAGITLPGYIGAMLAAAVIRNIDDRTGWFGLSHRLLDTLGAVALSLFLAMALMTLKLWELSGLALPLIVNLIAQILLVAAVCLWPVFQIMGRDYDAAVSAGGFVGFMLGTTANAMAVMRELVERYGPAPRAFLVAPLVGAFFMDFTNALVITVFLNLFR